MTAMMWKISSTNTKASTDKASNAECLHTGLLPKIGEPFLIKGNTKFNPTCGQQAKIPLNSRAPSCARQAGWRYKMGSLYKRGNVWWIKYYRNGKSFRESSNTTKKWWQKNYWTEGRERYHRGKSPGSCSRKSHLMNWPMSSFGIIKSTKRSRLQGLKSGSSGIRVLEG